MVTNRNNNTLETHEKITLNKDDDIGGSQISVIIIIIMSHIYIAQNANGL